MRDYLAAVNWGVIAGGLAGFIAVFLAAPALPGTPLAHEITGGLMVLGGAFIGGIVYLIWLVRHLRQ